MLVVKSLFTYQKKAMLCVLLSVICYYIFAYHTVRTNYVQLLSIYFILFGLAYVLKKSAGFNFAFLMVSALLFRGVSLFALPNLSQDFYRFIWDGRLLYNGINPYLHTPTQLIQNAHFSLSEMKTLYSGMGALSASHFSNYPPINQLLFYSAAVFANKSILGSVIVLRCTIILADIGCIYFGKKLLEHLKLPVSNIWFYALNPFIIFELSGNLHFEGVMLFFLIWSLYLLYTKRWFSSAVVLACSVSVKLIPLMFLPLYFWWFAPKKQPKLSFVQRLKAYVVSKKIITLLKFYSAVLITTVVLFVPFFSSEFITNYSKTVGLWFTNFEFNASIYYLLREIGFWATGYNQIAIIGKLLPVITICILLYISFVKPIYSLAQLIRYMLLAFACYLFLSTTVHPWYITTLLLLSVFTNYKFPLLWSVVIIFSYLAYLGVNKADKSENLWLIAFQYSVVYGAFFYEVLYKPKRFKKHFVNFKH